MFDRLNFNPTSKLALAFAAIATLGGLGSPANAERSPQIAQRQTQQSQSAIQIPNPGNVEYERYHNRRYDVSFLYPANLVSFETGGHNNQIYTSPDNRIKIVATGYYNSNDRTIAQFYRQATRESPERNVTYQTRGENWFVVSGYENGKVFYNKTILNDGIVKRMKVRYDTALQPEFDRIVSEMSNSFRG
jgi:hypothetical protein